MLVTRNSPRASVYTVIGAPGPFTITDTPGSTPPCSSTTFPKMPPVDCPYCAITALGRTIAHTKRTIADTIHGNRFGIDPPFNSLALLDPLAGGLIATRLPQNRCKSPGTKGWSGETTGDE